MHWGQSLLSDCVQFVFTTNPLGQQLCNRLTLVAVGGGDGSDLLFLLPIPVYVPRHLGSPLTNDLGCFGLHNGFVCEEVVGNDDGGGLHSFCS